MGLIDQDGLPLSRRAALVRLGRLGALGGLAGTAWGCATMPASAGAAGAATSSGATIFALLGDRYHNSDHYRTGFGKTIVRDMGVSVDFSDEVKLLDPDHLRHYRMLIILRDGINWPNGHGNPTSNAGWWSQGQHEILSEPPVPDLNAQSEPWMTPEMGRAVRQFVEGGGGALFMHNVTNVSVHNDDFREVMGGVYQGHPDIRPYRVRILNRDHPITRDVNDFLVTDEQHYMEYQKDPRFLLAESVNAAGTPYRDLGPSAAAAWAYDYGAGRVCYLSPGHLITALWNPEYEKMQRNAVRWLLRET